MTADIFNMEGRVLYIVKRVPFWQHFNIFITIIVFIMGMEISLHKGKNESCF